MRQHFFAITQAECNAEVEPNGALNHGWRKAATFVGNTRDKPGFEQQAHRIGRVFKISRDNGVCLQSTARFGLINGSDDSMFKLFVGREFCPRSGPGQSD